MAKHPKSRRRRRGKILKAQFVSGVALVTLANNTGILLASSTVNEKTFALSIESTHSLQGATVNEGPIDIYMAHSDYSLAEVEEYIESSGSWDEGNLQQQEVAKRKIRYVGTFENTEVEDQGFGPVKTPLKFMLLQGQGLNMVTYNRSGASLTTGSNSKITGHVWLKPT